MNDRSIMEIITEMKRLSDEITDEITPDFSDELYEFLKPPSLYSGRGI